MIDGFRIGIFSEIRFRFSFWVHDLRFSVTILVCDLWFRWMFGVYYLGFGLTILIYNFGLVFGLRFWPKNYYQALLDVDATAPQRFFQSP